MRQYPAGTTRSTIREQVYLLSILNNKALDTLQSGHLSFQGCYLVCLVGECKSTAICKRQEAAFQKNIQRHSHFTGPCHLGALRIGG